MKIGGARLGLHGNDVGGHHVADEQRLQRVDLVLAVDVVAAAGDLLGQDRALQDQHAQQMRGRAGDQQRQQRIDVMRQLDREHDARERRARDAGQRGGEPEQRVGPGRSVRKDVPGDRADRGAEHQQRREDPAARVRAERDRPDGELADQQQHQRAERELGVSSSRIVS